MGHPPEFDPKASQVALSSVLLLASKLFVPLPAAALLDRPRLVARVGEGLRRSLTLIAAPPGWGKTTLLTAWLAMTKFRPIAWVSLDAGDNDPARFWSYVIGALQQSGIAAGDASLAALQSHQPAHVDAALTPLLNELAMLGNDAALVLDDYHVIDTHAIHQGLRFFIDHLPPRLHVFVATRADPPLPLARLRARDALLEVRGNDLRFTLDETEQFLRDLMGLPLSDGMVATLAERTEGWVAGLQLAALAIRDRGEPANFVNEFSGSHRFVADFLVEEVIQRQTSQIQEFLLRTSILDRMSAALCDALYDSDQTLDSQRILEQLDRSNLFLIPLDAERRWYRYHHLFADLLRAQLRHRSRDELRSLHLRASRWFERSGLHEEAIHHALQAEDFAGAANLLEPVADRLWMSGQMATLRGLMDQLPADVKRSHPNLLIAQAGAQFYLESREIGSIEALLDEAEAALLADLRADPKVSEPLSARIAALRSAQASWHGDTGHTIALAQATLDRLGSEDAVWRLLGLTSLGMGYALRGEPAEAVGPLTEAAQLSPVTGASYVGLGPRLWLGLVHVMQGKLRDAHAWFRGGLDQIGRHVGENLTSANFLVGLGCWVEYEWNQLDAAERHLEDGIRFAGRQQWPWVAVDAYATLARIKRMRGESDAVRDLLQRMERHAHEVEIPWPWMAPRLAASMTRAYLAFGEMERAAQWAAQFQVSDATDLDYSVEVQRITAGRLLIAKGEFVGGLTQLDRLVAGAEAHGRWGRLIEIHVLRSLALEALGRRHEALAALGEALVLAEAEGYVRRFVDEGPLMKGLLYAAIQRGIAPTYVAGLLRGFADGTEPVNATPASQESLSDRERDVLRLLIAGYSGPQIAEALVVAPSTIKTHLKSIYGKLDVHSRDQAIARTNELKLL